MVSQSNTGARPLTRLGHGFTGFMASGGGRIARAGLGVALIVTGLAVVAGPAGWAVAGFGLVPLAAGAFNLCPIAPLWGGQFLGASYCARRANDN